MTDWRDNIQTGEEFLMYARLTGGHATDGALPATWRHGWAVHPFGGGHCFAHWYRRSEATPEQAARGVTWTCRSICCRVSTHETRYDEELGSKGIPLLSPGNCQRCKLCAAKVRRIR